MLSLFLFPYSFGLPVTGLLTVLASACTPVAGIDLHPFTTVHTLNESGFPGGNVILQIIYNVLAIAEPQQLFISLVSSIQIFSQHIGNGFLRIPAAGEFPADLAGNIMKIVHILVFPVRHVSVLPVQAVIQVGNFSAADDPAVGHQIPVVNAVQVQSTGIERFVGNPVIYFIDGTSVACFYL
jgi:hypothetical protein